MEHLGDIKHIDGGEIEPCELVTFGSPCVDISIAGKGGGISAERSGLFFEAIRVIREMLEATVGEYPVAFLFENVPNLLSIHGGADWNIVMDSFSDLGFICDPNILDSQEFGVAQRRKRIFIVGINRRYFSPSHFDGITNARAKRMQRAVDVWGGETFHGITSRPHEIHRQRLSEILERDVDAKYYLSDTACSGILRRVDAKGKEIPGLLRAALEYQAGLPCSASDGAACSFEAGSMVRKNSRAAWEDIAPTLRAAVHGGDNHPSVAMAIENYPSDSRMGVGGSSVPLCTEPVVYGISSVASHAMNSPNPKTGVYETNTAKTLDTSTQAPCNQGGLVICATTGSYAQACKEQSPTLQARDYKSPPVINQPGAASAPPSYIVRRLTPRECLVLMNLPPDWCDGIEISEPTETDYTFWESVFSALGKKKSRKQIGRWLAKPYSDGACYKMAGNGVVTEVARWVLDGIVNYVKLNPHSTG